MPPKTQEEKEQEAAEGSPGVGGTILSMLSSIGGMIPSLLKGPQTSELQRIQRGGGAGAALARQTASEAARRVAGNVQGTDLREGLRAADSIVQRGAAQASITGARESLAATSMLRGNELSRRSAFKTLGAGLGQGLAGIGATLAAAKDQGPVQPGEAGAVDSQTGEAFPTQTPDQVAADHQAAFIDESQQKLEAFQQKRLQAMPPADQGPELPAPAGGPGDPVFDQQQSNLASAPPASIGDVIAQATNPMTILQKSVEAMEQAGMARREAMEGYAALHSGGEQMSIAAAAQTDPGGIAEYIYVEAQNYNPTINQGLEPWEAAKMLQMYGLPVDWQRLGIVDVGPQQAPSTPLSPHGELERKALSGASRTGEKIRAVFTGGSGEQ